MKRRLLNYFIFFALVFVLVWPRLICGLQSYIEARMFAPQAFDYTWQSEYVINIGTHEKPLAALWMPVSNATHTVIYCHGNAEDIFTSYVYLEALRAHGISVLSVDYPGYGLSAGRPTEAACYRAVDIGYEFLTRKHNTPPSSIVVLGFSIGSGPACYLAATYPIGGLILEAAFTSAPRVVTGPRLLPVDPFPNLARMPSITCPKLFIHGTDDQIVPFSHGKMLFNAAHEPKTARWVPGAGHVTFIETLTYPVYQKLLLDFITSLPSASARTP